MTHWKQKVAMATSYHNGYCQICKMSIKGVKLKSESFFSISPGVLELWRKNLRGGGFRPPGPDRVKTPSGMVFTNQKQLDGFLSTITTSDNKIHNFTE